jgi:hypothetical protein
VNATPAAIDSPADPTVCVMLFSRMVARPRARKIVIDSTAIGIEALTVGFVVDHRLPVEAGEGPPMLTSTGDGV